MSLWEQSRNCYNLVEKCSLIQRIQKITIYSNLHRFLLMRKIKFPRRLQKVCLAVFWLRKIKKKFWENGVMNFTEGWHKIIENESFEYFIYRRIIVLTFVVVIITFQALYPPTFIKCLSTGVSFSEFQPEAFI